MIQFTKDELFFIEQEFDVFASLNHRRFVNCVEKIFWISNSQIPDKDKIIKMLFIEIEELNESTKIVREIRNKLEKERKGDLNVLG